MGVGEGEMKRPSTEDFQGSEMLWSYNYGYTIIILLSKESKTNGLWLIRMCQCRFILNKNTHTILVCNVSNGGRYARVRAESLWKISVLSPQFSLPITAVTK